MDYYSYKPLVTLDRPLVLTGVPGTDVTGITRMVGSFTGLPVLLMERKLSHALEHHPDRYTAEGRHADRWASEKRLLDAAFSASRPVVAMPSQSVLRMGALGWLADHADTVYVQESLEVVLARVAAAPVEKHWLLTRGEPLDRALAAREITSHASALDACPRRLTATKVESHGIAREIIAALGLDS